MTEREELEADLAFVRSQITDAKYDTIQHMWRQREAAIVELLRTSAEQSRPKDD